MLLAFFFKYKYGFRLTGGKKRFNLISDPPPKKMVLSATVPKEFHFNTDARVKATSSSSAAHKDMDFISQLRKPSSPVSPSFLGLCLKYFLVSVEVIRGSFECLTLYFDVFTFLHPSN